MLLIALSCVLRPLLSCTFEKLFTSIPPVHVQFVVHDTVLPLTDFTWAQLEPADALVAPHWSTSMLYREVAAIESHCPQCMDVSCLLRWCAADVASASASVQRKSAISAMSILSVCRDVVDAMKKV